MRCKPSFFTAIATSITMFAIATPIFANPAPNTSWKVSQQNSSSPLPQTASLIYVAPNPNGRGDGSQNNPFSSIASAIASKPTAGTVIQLQQGVYSAETGESFPIRLPVGVTLRGEPTVKGLNTLIRGGGKFISPSFASQNITVLADNDARLEGITLTNPNTRGTAVWVESGQRVAIANNTFTNSDREGLFLTGNADAIVSENVFKKNGANGLSAVGSSKGEIRNNVFEQTGFGLAIGQKSRVNVSNNDIINNTDGIIISNLSAPTLRNNLIADNQRNGVVILKDRKGYPTPNLGTSTNLGKNIFRNNLGKALNNNSGVTQVAVGNQLDPKSVEGDIAFVGENPTAPAPQTLTTPFLPAPKVPSLSSATTNPNDVIEITRSPQPVINNQPAILPTALAPSKNSILIEPLPDVPEPVTQTTAITPVAPLPSTNLSQDPNEVLIDRDPIPVAPPQSIFVPNTSPQTTPTAPTSIPPTSSPVQPNRIPYNPRIAAFVPQPARDRFPYLVVVTSLGDDALNRVRSIVPSAQIIPSRFGNIIMVQGYPDRDRAEVLKMIMRSETGLDARVVHQNNL